MSWFYLAAAILAEVGGTTAMTLSDGFTRLVPSLVTVLCYAVAFFFLSLTLRTIPVGVAYAVWSGAGTALIALIGVLAFGQRLDGPGIAGITLILAGVLVLNLLSKSAVH